MSYKLVSKFKPMGDQPEAIKELVEGIHQGKKTQVLLGGTGTGKTFTFANVIAQVNKPTLVLSHNKTLAGQLYSELKEFFPENRVEYFISNFDFYQPEAYIPKSDTYIDKESQTNEEIEMLRAAAMNSLLERKDTIVVASVAAIYGLGNPQSYQEMIFSLRVGQEIDRRELLTFLVDRQYTRNDMDQVKGTFRVRGDVIEIVPGHTESYIIRIELFGDEVDRITEVDPLTGHVQASYNTYTIYPAEEYITSREKMLHACDTIEEELKDRLQYYQDAAKPLEYERIDNRTRHDIEMLREVGICPGIENYSRHIDGRKPGERPYCLLDYFPDDFLLIVDESHVMLPQIRGMFNGDRSRKETLVEYGFRLPSALDKEEFIYLAYLNSLKNNTTDGTILTLEFTAKNEAEFKPYIIAINVEQAINVNGDDIALKSNNGAVSVVKCVHVSDTKWESDADTHWHNCKYSDCKEKILKTVEKHTVEVIPAVSATCTEDGLTSGKKCSVCGYIIEKQQVVKATGHTSVKLKAVKATTKR